MVTAFKIRFSTARLSCSPVSIVDWGRATGTKSVTSFLSAFNHLGNAVGGNVRSGNFYSRLVVGKFDNVENELPSVFRSTFDPGPINNLQKSFL